MYGHYEVTLVCNIGLVDRNMNWVSSYTYLLPSPKGNGSFKSLTQHSLDLLTKKWTSGVGELIDRVKISRLHYPHPHHSSGTSKPRYEGIGLNTYPYKTSRVVRNILHSVSRSKKNPKSY